MTSIAIIVNLSFKKCRNVIQCSINSYFINNIYWLNVTASCPPSLLMESYSNRFKLQALVKGYSKLRLIRLWYDGGETACQFDVATHCTNVQPTDLDNGERQIGLQTVGSTLIILTQKCDLSFIVTNLLIK